MKRAYILLTALLGLLTACTDKNQFGDGYSPALQAYYLHLETDAVSFAADGGSRTLQVKGENASWRFSGYDHSWLSIQPDAGTGDQTVVLLATANPSTTDGRTSVFPFAANAQDFNYERQVSVTQERSAVTLTVEPRSLAFDAAGGSLEAAVTSNAEWQVSVPSDASWLSAVKNNGTSLVVSATANLTTDERNATLTVSAADKTATVSIRQSPATDPSVTPEVTQTLNYPNTGGRYTLNISSEVPWTATTSQSWLTVTPTEGQAGNTEFSIDATTNGSADRRSGNVYISIGTTRRITIPVEQEASYVRVGQASLTFDSQAGTLPLQVESNTNWTVLQKPDWLTVEPSAPQTGNATLQLSATAWDGQTDREGQLVVGQAGTTLQATVALRQKSSYFSINPSVGVSHPSKGGSQQLHIATNEAWTATSTSSWIQLSQRSGNGDVDVTLTAPDNPSINSREDVTTFTPSSHPPVCITTTQAGRYLRVNTTGLDFATRGGTSDAVTIETDATFTIRSTETWLTVSLNGNTFTATAAPNTTGQQREASIALTMTGLVAGESYVLTIPVVQRSMLQSYVVLPWGDDQPWDLNNNVTISVTGFGDDQSWDGHEHVTINMTGFGNDQSWD